MYSGNRIVWWLQPVNSIGLFWLWHPDYCNKLRTNLHHLNSTAFQHSMEHLCMACPNVEVILAGMLKRWGIVKCRWSFPGCNGFLTTAFMARPNVDMILLKGEVIKCRRSLRRERCSLMVSSSSTSCERGHSSKSTEQEKMFYHSPDIYQLAEK